MSDRRRSTLVAVVAAVALLVGCGAESASPSRPPTSANAPAPSRFDDLPRLPGSDPYGPSTNSDGDVISRSFRTEGSTVDRVMDFYDRTLTGEGWTPTTPLDRAPGPGRATYLKDGYLLEISAIAVEDRSEDGSQDAVVQYSLVLRPQ